MHPSHALAVSLFLLAIVSAPARADDFASDLASCAKAPIVATSFASDELRKAATFVTQHAECVPMVTSGDPLLYGITPGFIYLQNQGVLAKSAQGCVDDTLGKGSREISGVLAKFADAPPMSTLLPSKSKQLLIAIANGQSDQTLYQVPGVSMLMDHVSCACAVSSSAIDINELSDKIKQVVQSINGCKNVLGKLLGKAYDVLKGGYGAAKDAVNSVGCTLGLGGCSSGPPFFCTGYFSARGQGVSSQSILDSFPDISNFHSMAQSGIAKCEPQWQAMLDAKQKADAQAKADKLLKQEIEKAEKLGSANALGFAFRWSPKCYEDVCKKGIANLANQYNKDINDPDTIKQYGSFGAAVWALEKKYGAIADLAIKISRDRRDKQLRDDLNAPVGERLGAFGCKLFLGRAQQSMCEDQKGYDVCVDYVLGGKWHMCSRTGVRGFYSAGAALDEQLKLAGCIPDRTPRSVLRGGRIKSRSEAPLLAQCLSQSALVNCGFYRDGRSAVTCSGVQPLRFDRGRLPNRLQPVEVAPPAVLPVEPVRPIRVHPGLAPMRPVQVDVPKSTLCVFEAGPRAGQRQDYAPMDPLPVGTPCQDGRGSTGHVVAP
ncbi:MAG: hypothetical protein ABL973_16840 [Micropepsaceae bacterium]